MVNNQLGFWGEIIGAVAGSAINVGGQLIGKKIDADAISKQVAAQIAAQQRIAEKQIEAAKVSASNTGGAIVENVKNNWPIYGGIVLLAAFAFRRN